jgi:hypothetical protein
MMENDYENFIKSAYEDLRGKDKDRKKFYKKIFMATGFKENKSIITPGIDPIISTY